MQALGVFQILGLRKGVHQPAHVAIGQQELHDVVLLRGRGLLQQRGQLRQVCHVRRGQLRDGCQHGRAVERARA